MTHDGASAEPAQRSIRRHLIGRVAAVVLLVGGVGGWAATDRDRRRGDRSGHGGRRLNVKKVQHPTGGVVGELRVRDGDRVKAGDVLVRLDETVTRANLAIVTKALDELHARQARLEAERDGAETSSFPRRAHGARADDAGGRAGDRRRAQLFELRRAARAGQKAQLAERITSSARKSQGLTVQVDREGAARSS